LNPQPTPSDLYRPWLFRWALLTALAVFPLIALGGLVTSLRAGMVDPQSVRVPWYMLTLAWESTSEAHGVGFLVEHSHRQLGWIVGVMTIILTGWILVVSRRTWLKGFAVAALLGVSLQGVLGILRVELNRAGWGMEFAMTHGITGQLVFAMAASVALFLSRSWLEGPSIEADGAARFRKMCRLTTLLLLAQLFIGVWLRQVGSGPGWWVLIVHGVLALAVLAHAVMLVVRARRPGLRDQPLLQSQAVTVLALVLVQIAVGGAGWWFGAGAGTLDYRQVTPERAVLPTLHVGIGALILMTTVLLTFRSYRHLQVEPKPVLVGVGAAEGVA
jgi:heme A synthase